MSARNDCVSSTENLVSSRCSGVNNNHRLDNDVNGTARAVLRSSSPSFQGIEVNKIEVSISHHHHPSRNQIIKHNNSEKHSRLNKLLEQLKEYSRESDDEIELTMDDDGAPNQSKQISSNNGTALKASLNIANSCFSFWLFCSLSLVH